jgi:hypothetical protein
MRMETKRMEGQLDCTESAPCVEGEEGDEWVVVRDGCADLRFTGTVVAEESSREWSGPRSLRWDVLELYRTRSGTWVCSREHHTRYAKEQGSREGAVCAGTAEVVQFFGYGFLAKQLYAVAGIRCAEAIA